MEDQRDRRVVLFKCSGTNEKTGCVLFSSCDNVWTNCDPKHLQRSLSRHERSAKHIQSQISLKTLRNSRIDLALDEQRRLNTSVHNAMRPWTSSIKEVVVNLIRGRLEGISSTEAAIPFNSTGALTPRHCQSHQETGVLPEFDSIDKTNPNCVVIGDAAENFSYQNLNEAFRVLVGLEKPVLFSMGQGRYYKETDGLKLDVGVFMKALEYACDLEAEVIGKPSPMFFQTVLGDMNLQPHEALMIGDDLVNDVGGAQHCGMKGVQVRTGKYRPSDERHPTVTADGTVDNLAQAVDMILAQRGH
uniref:Phospholysine phosphohistidine inorganic pyrophosphate phosphatase n=1 Tax=Cynoglossus semilaevis TaxID=244447 RepID=A0A3P8WPT7_CYNSE